VSFLSDDLCRKPQASSTIIGYKLRGKIRKALRACSGAIKTALKAYNEAAARLDPPRDPMTWSTVLKAVTVADFDLLCETRSDICALPWAEPARREATLYYFGIKQAKEEIMRLNVEITCLLTFMMDSHIDYSFAIQNLLDSNPSLVHDLSVAWEYQNCINEAIVCKLVETSKLPGFSGGLHVGQCVGHSVIASDTIAPPSWARFLPTYNTNAPFLRT